MPSRVERKLAAIMFTDIAGYTALSAKDEKKALKLLDIQTENIYPIIKEFNGTINKTVGDGLLITFPTVTSALECGINIQEASKSFPDLNIRIGIHEGEITTREGDVFGDDVNIASRIEAFSAIGGIAISDKVQRNISSLPEYETKFVGKPDLKGVSQSVEIFCIVSHGLIETDIKSVDAKLDTNKGKFSLSKSIVLPATGIFFTIVGALVWFIYPLLSLSIANTHSFDKKIAILYFENQGNNDEVYFSDGLSEEIMNRLTKIENLDVVPSFEVKKYKNQTINLDLVGEELDPDYVLYGNITRNQKQFRFSVELIDLNDKSKVWGQTYEKENEKIFEVQGDVTDNIIAEIGINISSTDHMQALTNPTDNLTAYELLLKAKTESYTIVNDYDKILEMIDKINYIISQDPEYADALSILSTYKAMLFNNFSDEHYTFKESQKIIDESIELAELSIKYDSENELALSMLPMAISMRLFVTESTAKKMLFGRRIMTELKNLANYFPNSYLTKFAFGNFYNIKSSYPIIANDTDINQGIKYLSESCDIIEKMFNQNSSDPKIHITYERGIRQLSSMHSKTYKFEKSRYYLNKQITFFNNHSRYDKLIMPYNDLGRIEHLVGNYDKSVDNYLAVQKNAKLSSNYYQEILASIKIANTYTESNKAEIAVELLNESLEMINNRYENKLLIQNLYYKLLYQCYESIALAEFINNNISLSEKYSQLSIEYLGHFINDSNMSASSESRYKSFGLQNKIVLAQCNIKSGDINGANKMLSETLQDIEEYGIYYKQKREVNYRLAQTYEMLNDTEYHSLYIHKASDQFNLILNEIDNNEDKKTFKEDAFLNISILNKIKLLDT